MAATISPAKKRRIRLKLGMLGSWNIDTSRPEAKKDVAPSRAKPAPGSFLARSATALSRERKAEVRRRLREQETLAAEYVREQGLAREQEAHARLRAEGAIEGSLGRLAGLAKGTYGITPVGAAANAIERAARDPSLGSIARAVGAASTGGMSEVGTVPLIEATTRTAQGKPSPWDALTFAAILPPLRGGQAAARLLTGKGGKAALGALNYQGPGPIRTGVNAARRTITVGEKTQQFPSARSAVTRTLIEKPADIISQKFPKAPLLGAEARVAKRSGRQTLKEAQRAHAMMTGALRALPKEGSPEDVAHFWWAQLPKVQRTAAGLTAVRMRQAAELERITSGKALADLQKQKAAVTAKLGKAEGAERFGLLSDLQQVKLRISDLPILAKEMPISLAQLDQVIAKTPELNEKTLTAVRTLSEDRRAVLEEAGLLTPDRADARQGLVSRWLGLEPTGEEAFIGHRLDRVRNARPSLTPPALGTGKPRVPPGVARENKLVLAQQARLRPSTQVAAEDWQATQTSRQAIRARDDLGKMGPKFEGHLPEGYMLLNPKGRAVPLRWKTDKIAKLTEQGYDEEEIRRLADEIQSGFLADRSRMDELLDAAKAQGVKWDELRIVPEKTVRRYYGQFTPAAGSSVIGKAYDTAVDFTAASIIFARLGYIPKNIAQNLIMAAPHQGAYLLANAPRAAALIPRPGQSELDRQLWTLMANEVGLSGPTLGLAQEARFAGKLKGAPGKIAHVVSGTADTPLRVSALIHELAAEGVIPKLKPFWDEADKRAALQALTDKEMRPLLDDASSRAVEAMGDFSRMTPTQRRWARRFLIIPGWLWAGSRYPIHFAATHPGRSAALAYIGAGEPGAPESLKVNRPFDEYFAKGVPSYLEGIATGGDTLLRTRSLSPVNTPWDIGAALIGGSPRTAFEYANPLGAAGVNIANRTVNTPAGPYRTGYLNSIKRNLERLVPNVRLARDLISPPSEPGLYPEDASRLGRLGRELGVIPIKIDKRAAYEAAKRAGELSAEQKVRGDHVWLRRDYASKLKEAGLTEAQKGEIDMVLGWREYRELYRLKKYEPVKDWSDRLNNYRSDLLSLYEAKMISEATTRAKFAQAWAIEQEPRLSEKEKSGRIGGLRAEITEKLGGEVLRRYDTLLARHGIEPPMRG